MRRTILLFVFLAGATLRASDTPSSVAAPPSVAAQPPVGAQAPATAPSSIAAEPPHAYSIVRVNVTNQPWDLFRPWGKRTPYSRRAVGAVLPNDRVLVTAELVANANYLEFETPEGGQKVPATVEAVDYEANLALLKTDDEKFLKPFKPLDLSIAAVGDTLTVLQLETNGALLMTRGTMTNAEVARYPIDDSTFLLYHLAATLQFRDAAFTLPVVKGEKLVGLVMRYESQSTNCDIVPAPIIEHFLRDVAQQPYKGFPRAGVAYASTRDPQLRRYSGLTEKTPGGVYTTELQKDGPAARAGIELGDVLLRVDDVPVDQDGNYSDPVYGKISVSHLLSTRHFAGDDVKFTVFHKGAIRDCMVHLEHRAADQYAIEPYLIDHPPKFYILGGLVLEELSRQYLKEWGPEWTKKAPEDLVFMDRNQAELCPDEKQKVVFLSRVLPSDVTVGYEELHHLVITKINGQEIHALRDVPAALAKASNGLHKIEFNGEPDTIYLDAKQVAETEPILTKAFQLPSLKRLD